MKPSRGCSGITRHACTQLWATSAPSSLNSSGIEQPKQSQADLAARAKQAMEKQESKSTLSNFPTATTTTNYNPVWDTDSEGKIRRWVRPCMVVGPWLRKIFPAERIGCSGSKPLV